MSTLTAKARFAPSPTGWLHLGNLRTALFNALFARGHGGTFLLRIEDTDAERSKAEYVDDLQQDLLWLGLDWQEGPGKDRGHAPYFQSEREPTYQKYYELLEQQGLAYYCFCSETELSLARKRQLAAGHPPRYLGTCAHLSREEVAKRINAGAKPALRFRVPRGQRVEFEDLVRGPQQYATDDIGDFIIRRANGASAFFFCNAIDDALMDVTHVLRGEDHLTNTPRQILILQALELHVPQYGHISMIVGNDGAPLSKRHGSRSIRELRAEGYMPLAVINYLARLGHHFESTEFLAIDALAKGFELHRLGRSPARFDPEQLLHWQHMAVASASEETLWQWIGDDGRRWIPDVQRHDFFAAVKPNLTLPEHAHKWAYIVFGEALSLNETARAAICAAPAGFFDHAAAAVTAHGVDFKAVSGYIKDHAGAKGKALFGPLRAALTGELDGPELGALLPLMGPARLQQRFAAARAIAIDAAG